MIIRNTVAILFCMLFVYPVKAQDIDEKELLEDSLQIDSCFESNLDSMSQLYYVKESINIDSIESVVEPQDLIPSFSDEVYLKRLSQIPSVVNLSYNTLVRRFIETYTMKKRSLVEVMLGLSDYYFPMFDDIFDSYGVPTELKYLSVIESALNPRAYSRARATGIWQFMYSTGRMYGLEINSVVDERMDPIKATHAAAQYLKNMHDKFGDWVLAIASYNCGPGNVTKAIRRSGGKTDFWDIYFYLPRETRGYVPAYIAATYVMHYYAEHNLKPVSTTFPMDADTIMVSDKLHLKQVSEVIGIPIEQIRDMNPQYRYDIIPASGKKLYPLKLPENYIAKYIDNQNTIFAYKDSIFLSDEKLTLSPTHSNSYNLPEPPNSNMSKLIYSVKSGDNLGFISEWYNVRISDLKYWNNIRNNMIRSGQKLTVYVPKSKLSKYKAINSMSFAEKQNTQGKVVTSASNSIHQSSNTSGGGSYVFYTVKDGDTLWDIARAFPGTSDAEIMKLNNITDASKIRPGLKLKIKTK